MKLGFIGLGTMGFAMAGHLKRAGHEVTIFNRNQAKAQKWVAEYGGTSAATPADAARHCDMVLACVGRDADVEAVTLGEGGAFAGMKKGALFVDHTTASARLARALAGEADRRGFMFLDAPVSGGEAGAVKGALTIMCGGSEAAFATAKPVIAAYARHVQLMGPAGAGQLTKMVNQICIAGILQGLAEGFSFARAAGLDITSVVDVIAKGAAQSWQMDNRHRTMAAGEYDHGFAVEWMRKDLDLCFREARANGVSLPLVALVDQFYAEVEAMGGSRWDTSSLFARLETARKGIA